LFEAGGPLSIGSGMTSKGVMSVTDSPQLRQRVSTSVQSVDPSSGSKPFTVDSTTSALPERRDNQVLSP
jgi:hypothetical protein